ncbi:MAG TPA: hypothetical protein VK957_16290 [Lunatimonas sp.]|nr:hypothetical protein [Lunatimonas sp.]
MKKYINKASFIVAFTAIAYLTSCVEGVELATPNVASPVLVMLQGTTFDATAPVSVEGRFYELDKTGILDQNIGIDSIPVAGLQIRVFINQTDEVGSATTDSAGKIVFEQPWTSLGVASPTSGRQIRLEFAGTHKNIAFRQYHNVRVR